MNNHTNKSRADRQYLNAMDIDLWVARDKIASDNGDRVQTSASLISDASSLPPINTILGADLCSSVSTMMAAAQVHNADLLLLIEGPQPTAEGVKLLGSMFKAIELESAQWLPASIVSDNSAATMVSSIVESVDPKAIVLLARSNGDLNSLDHLRGTAHRSAALKPFVVVTFHPQDLLDNPAAKRPAWEDLKQLRQWLG